MGLLSLTGTSTVGGGFQAPWRESSSSNDFPRAHLPQGKAGFPERGCFNGAAEYPDTWCDFGCAIQRLDPDGKFEDNTQWWNFRGVDLERCCTASGFQSSWFGCTCNPEPLPGFQDCPAPNPPGYEPPLNDFDYDCTA